MSHMLCEKTTIYGSKLYKYKEKLVILHSIGIIVIKRKETRVVTYTCRYSSGHLIHKENFVILQEIGII